MSNIPQVTYPFADVELARRLERTEAQGSRDFVEARSIVDPALGAEWIEVGGTYAMFDGVSSPITQTFGLGMFEAVTEEDLSSLEHFFHEREADVFHEVCPLADPSAFVLLNERRYQPMEYSSVLYRPIMPEFRLTVATNKRIHVRQIDKNEKEVWAQTAFDGWSEFSEFSDFLHEMGEVQAHSNAVRFIAEADGNAIATGLLIIDGDVALLAGASTVPTARRQGAQLAMLEARLRYAARSGCTIAMMVAQPGGASQRNAERHGFRIAYTRTKWQLRM